MDMDNKFNQYKLLVDIYYKELSLSYTKATIFITIQLGVLAGTITAYKMLAANPVLFCVGISFMICLSFIQILIAFRANTVNEALIHTLSEFEQKNGFTLLSDFSKNTKKINRISKMNFPSYAMVVLCGLFLLTWLTILFIVLFPLMKQIVLVFSPKQQFGVLRSVIICIFSMLYAVTMKISDLLDEHGLHLFKGASYFFSFLCALFGCLLIMSDDIIANIIFAMIIGFVVRKRLDYNNHIFAFVIISSCFLVYSNLLVHIYFPFLSIIIILGLLKDTKYINSNSKAIKVLNKVYLYVPIIYALPSFVYSIITSNWTVFFTFFVYDLSYNITRLIGERIIPSQMPTSVSYFI